MIIQQTTLVILPLEGNASQDLIHFCKSHNHNDEGGEELKRNGNGIYDSVSQIFYEP